MFLNQFSVLNPLVLSILAGNEVVRNYFIFLGYFLAHVSTNTLTPVVVASCYASYFADFCGRKGGCVLPGFVGILSIIELISSYLVCSIFSVVYPQRV